ncbi:MAG: PAS domain S-box protein [candidate division Zixibacteria bacterium]|nr:PAS domain S-box protein [candidate division Zixibacteria bacterium]
MTDGNAASRRHAQDKKSRVLRVLMVEDSEDDAILISRELSLGDWEIQTLRVASLDSMTTALSDQIWDAVIADYNLPGFSALDALRVIQSGGLDLPFIIVSGAIGEETAVDCMKAGAHDYIVKDNLTRLLPAINRELREAANRRQHRLAEQALKESRRKLATLMSNLPGMAYRCRHDDQWTMEFISDGCNALTGYDPEQLYHNAVKSYQDLIHPDDQNLVREEIENALAAKHAFTLEYRIATRSGEEKWVWEQGCGVFSDSGELEALEGLITDITERKHIETALQESMERFRNIIDASAAGYFFVDCDGNYRYVNDAWLRMHKYTSRDAIIGRHFSITQPDETAEQIDDRLSNLLSGDSIHSCEFARKCCDGAIGYHVFSANPVIKAGQTIGFEGFLIDITDRRRAEEALRQSEQQFRDIAEMAPEAIFEADAEGNLKFANRRVAQYFGMPQERTTSLNILDLIDIRDRQRAREDMDRILAGESLGIREYEARRDDGSTFPVTVHATRAILRGRQNSLRGVLIDITDRKKHEEELLKAQKLDSVGVLAGGLAHDFNNLLTGVLGNIALARQEAGADTDIAGLLGDAESAAIHAKELTRQLLTFSDGGDPVKESVVIDDLVREVVLKCLRGTASSAVFDFAPAEHQVEVDPGQLSQAIQNLAVNAIQAMPDGGTLRVMTDYVVVQTAGSLLPSNGRFVRVIVADDGVGIPPQNLQKIFDPYFSTKKAGSGLGLAATYSIVKKHGGHIEVESTEGAGTTVRLYLPAARAMSPLPTIAQRRQAPCAGKILVMDDEPVIRNLTAKILSRQGCRVTCACDGSEALELYREARDAGTPFDLVILDLVVPDGLGGLETVRRLAEIDPTVRAIVCSGYSDDPVMAEYESYGFHGVVAKPFRPGELCRAVSDVLTTRQGIDVTTAADS